MSRSASDDLYSKLTALAAPDTNSNEHKLYSLEEPKDRAALKELISEHPDLIHHDELISQCRELVKIKNPGKQYSKDALEEEARAFYEAQGGADYGNYVYYPWNGRLVRILPEHAFIRLRTSRNNHKITPEEQALLKQKKVGVIGLSVGQSVALTLCIERVCGSLRIADFDRLELSNLNRIRKGLDYLGVEKTTMVVREIAEIDPYLEVEVFREGIRPDNIDRFLGAGEEKLDLLVEECDALPIKVLSRIKAREKQIPVLMDTSDRGMLDIERFDLEPERPLFHGLVPEQQLTNLKELSEMQRMSVLFAMVGGDTLSSRLKASLIEMNQTLGSWPQLASSVTLGGAITTSTVRRILLGKKVKSGRVFIDLNALIPEEKEPGYMPPQFELPGPEARQADMSEYLAQAGEIECMPISNEQLEFVVKEAGKAPSSGNDQPWLFVYHRDLLFVFHRKDRSFSFGDFRDIASIQSIGAAVENLRVAAQQKGLDIDYEYIEKPTKALLKVVIRFKKLEKAFFSDARYLQAITERHTNRIVERPRTEIEADTLSDLKEVGESVKGTEIKFITDDERLKELGAIVSACDKIRVLNAWGHYDFFHREMRWTERQARERGDGIDIRSLEIAPEMMAAIKMLKEEEVINTLRSVKGGDGFNEISTDAIVTSAAVGLVIRPTFAPKDFFEGGIAWQRLWLKSTIEKIAVHPLIAPLYIFPRLVYGNAEGLSIKDIEHLNGLRKTFLDLWDLPEGKGEIFMFKLFKTAHNPVRAYRLPLKEILNSDV